jgi:hypothetical protein
MEKIARVMLPLAFVCLLMGSLAAIASAQATDAQDRDWITIGERKLARDQHFIDRAQSIVNNYTARGLDTRAMQAVINEAQSVVLDPMIRALAAGDEDAIKDALFLRLGNSNNSRATSGHYFAKFAVERIQSVLDHVEPIAVRKGLGHLVPPIQAKLDSARAQLDAVGFGPYRPGQGEAIWEDIADANMMTRDLINQLRNTTERPSIEASV